VRSPDNSDQELKESETGGGTQMEEENPSDQNNLRFIKASDNNPELSRGSPA
jgi:hypothetical protein